MHGGGFVLGDLDTDHARNIVLARELGGVVVSVDYRLAPETPFPGPAPRPRRPRRAPRAAPAALPPRRRYAQAPPRDISIRIWTAGHFAHQAARPGV
ncbi:alpha/beta hydrolase fold domain-containing protein [Pseudonocardia humida]